MIKAFLKIVGMILLPLVIGNLIYYLIGAFIAWDWDLRHWWLVKTALGRVIIILLEMGLISSIPKFWEG